VPVGAAPLAELAEEAEEVWVELGRVGLVEVRRRPPSSGVELAAVWCQRLLPAGVQDEPQTHVGVAGVDADGPGDGHEDGPFVQSRVVAGEAEFLGDFPASRVGGVFVDLDVSAGSLGSRMLSYLIFLGADCGWFGAVDGRVLRVPQRALLAD
jgi:hypothetical protein